MFGESGGEELDFVVKKTVKVVPLVCGVVVKSLETCGQILKIARCWIDGRRLDRWKGVVYGFPLLPKLCVLAVRVSCRFIDHCCRCSGLTPGSKGGGRLCIVLFWFWCRGHFGCSGTFKMP